MEQGCIIFQFHDYTCKKNNNKDMKGKRHDMSTNQNI